MCWVDAFYVMSGSRFGRPSLSLLAQERQVCNVNSFQLPRMHLSTKSCLLLTWGRAQGKPVAHIFIKIHENPRWPWCLCGFTGACHTSGMVGQGLEVCWGYCPGGDTLTHSPASQPGLCSCSALKVERKMFSCLTSFCAVNFKGKRKFHFGMQEKRAPVIQYLHEQTPCIKGRKYLWY